ncbi:proline dehydrogenase family protein [Planctomicrobium piriforme]|uniref:RHH-type transcriptional regulator, proline utilization regulon repressor / proline dehydrogenase / delta 1-pyrroline-5-carboxylate dehydrogenase n=1 Tax=Planctomicrobium piriforme TaxID=1576369 RepID=A0A1I3RR35_9PLAN|nr:proline dehydrogenase family protein [Planctomicrobium piriforme]SFJ47751.1 RHH-type transcriptional regulator, proline utilization regulon repressor / proline dehydrogenase / delta 1-pyrroline-5-carboxylate dehydrogenase [Planctomicrobium piriforme]
MASRTRKDAFSQQVEERTQEIGQDLWARLNRRKPTVFERRWWLDHILEWAMHDESVKVQMFRFVDVLPMLRSSTSVTQHLQEYFDEVRGQLPMAVRMGLDVAQPDSLLGKALAVNARTNARKMAERFIAGTTADEVFRSVAKLRKTGLAFTLDLLGEAVISEREAERYQKAYLKLVKELAPQVNAWSEDVVVDRDVAGYLPRCNVSLKLSALTSHFNPMDPEGSSKRVKERLRPILRLARKVDAFVNVDMEHYAFKDLTLQIFEEICMEDEFRDWPHVGIVIQAYLLDAGDDLARLKAWSVQRGTPIWVRLVKGAYWDHETITSTYRDWPCPVFSEKWQTDENFERQTRYLMENREHLRPAIASHNLRSLSYALALAELLQIPRAGWELQMLHGMAEEIQILFSEQEYRVRVYTPFGELLPGMSYLVRRLLENTSNESFLRQAYQSGVSIEELLRNPSEIGKLREVEAVPV